jgi:enoyl-CoA hydratase
MIRVEDQGDRKRIRVITIDRQERRNAVDHEALGALLAAVNDTTERVKAGDSTRVLVLAGAGGHFCSGADLRGVEDAAFAHLLGQVLDAWRDAPLPTMAAIEGAALGAGTQLAIACDLRVATRTAILGIPAAKIGLMVDFWTIQRLVALAGQGPAHAMLLAAQTYTGEEARSLGVVQRQGGVRDALAWAEAIAQLAPLTIAGHKVGLLETETTLPPPWAYDEAFERAWSSDDLREGIAAFSERRPPDFHAR